MRALMPSGYRKCYAASMHQADTLAKKALRTWALVVGLITAATLGGFLLEHHISLTSQAMLYVLAVVIAAYALERLPSVVCAVGAVTTFNFFFVPPRICVGVDAGLLRGGCRKCARAGSGAARRGDGRGAE